MSIEDEIKAEKEALEKENKDLKDAFNKKMDQELSDLPASLRGLVLRLSVQEQVVWLGLYKKEHPPKKKDTKKPTWEEISGKKKEIKHYPIDFSL